MAKKSTLHKQAQRAAVAESPREKAFRLLDEGKLEMAIRYLRRAGEVYPTDLEIPRKLAQVAMQLGRLEVAREALMALPTADAVTSRLWLRWEALAGDHGAVRRRLAATPDLVTVESWAAPYLEPLPTRDETRSQEWRCHLATGLASENWEAWETVFRNLGSQDRAEAWLFAIRWAAEAIYTQERPLDTLVGRLQETMRTKGFDGEGATILASLGALLDGLRGHWTAGYLKLDHAGAGGLIEAHQRLLLAISKQGEKVSVNVWRPWIEHLAAAAKERPELRETLVYGLDLLANLLQHQREAPTAYVPLIRRALEVSPDDPRLLKLAANALMDRPAQAMPVLEHWRKVSPQTSEPYEWLSMALERQHGPERALELLLPLLGTPLASTESVIFDRAMECFMRTLYRLSRQSPVSVLKRCGEWIALIGSSPIRAYMTSFVLDETYEFGWFNRPAALGEMVELIDRFIPDLQELDKVDPGEAEDFKETLCEMTEYLHTMVGSHSSSELVPVARRMADVFRRYVKAARRLSKPLKSIQAIAAQEAR